MAARLAAMGQKKYVGTTRKSGGRAKWTGRINLDNGAVDAPKSWKKDRLVFVNSMSDLFHERVPLRFIQRVFQTMNETPQHTYQVLTKRGERLEELSRRLNWTTNIWMGVSVEDADHTWRIDNLRSCGASTKFLSLEPLLGPLDNLNLSRIDWVIAGGESGPAARPMNGSWMRSIRDQCRQTNVAFFFKQWGGANKKKAGRLLDGRTWDELPNNCGSANQLKVKQKG